MTRPSGPALLDQAEQLLDAGRPRVAALLLDAAAAANADPVRTACNQARTSLDQANPHAALAYLAPLLHRQAPAPPPLATLLQATALMHAGRPAEAALHLDTAITRPGATAGLHVALAVALLGLHQPAAAAAAAARGHALFPADRDLHRLAHPAPA